MYHICSLRNQFLFQIYQHSTGTMQQNCSHREAWWWRMGGLWRQTIQAKAAMFGLFFWVYIILNVLVTLFWLKKSWNIVERTCKLYLTGTSRGQIYFNIIYLARISEIILVSWGVKYFTCDDISFWYPDTSDDMIFILLFQYTHVQKRSRK